MARRSVTDFLDSFVLPLVAGGTVHVGRPVTMAELDHFESDLPHASVPMVAIDEARANVLAELVVRPPALVLERDELSLAAGLHNMLFLAHPSTDSWLVTKGARRRVLDAIAAMVGQPMTRHRRRVLARHALLHNVFDVSRTDVKVSWWTGNAQFYGQEPPSRLVLWRSVRRVREESSTATYDQLLSSDEVAPVMATLLRRSPLTQLLASHPQAPPLHWEDAVFLLRDNELARAVAYHATLPGDATAALAAPARFAAAFEQMLERGPVLDDVRAVIGFLIHLSALVAMSEMRLRDRTAKSPLLTTVLARERSGHWPCGMATFLALPNALQKIDDRLAEPPGLREEPRLLQRWRVHREQVEAGVGEAVIETLIQRLSRQFQPALTDGGGPRLALPPAPADRGDSALEAVPEATRAATADEPGPPSE